ncbi:MAG: anti-sigma regulatory factor [Candidatus Parcubacteria bacterium]|uniref:ATP-binding protein n=1 Tax=Phormidesmis priestleyi TaxID=268141 RepID=UPI0009ED4F19|nr:anti-sigma regulatory factor [Phormidesmis priestleyi]MBC7823334.1 anti-sigma regulatory factor [Leptolyngbyaceae cyanobacterium LF-bin-113]
MAYRYVLLERTVRQKYAYPLESYGVFRVIAVSPRSTRHNWNTVSFASTLYLIPILDLLLAKVPSRWKAEIRLGLQEALVNAAKHGNNLDPCKKVLVHFSTASDHYWWVITDQGSGFEPCCHDESVDRHLPCDQHECGRGLYILHQVFDEVEWNSQGTELRLCKQVRTPARLPLVL